MHGAARVNACLFDRRHARALARRSTDQGLLAKQYNVLEIAKAVVLRCLLLVGCSDPILSEQVEGQGIKDDNLLHVLGIIEHRVHQYVVAKKGTAAAVRLQEKKHDKVICIVPPNAHDDGDSDDSVLKPVSHEQVLEELLEHGVDKATGGGISPGAP